MKYLILLIFCLGTTTMKCFSQTRSIENYGKTLQDTLFYLKYNFEENKDKYIGQTVKNILDDYELPYLRVFPSGEDYENFEPKLKGVHIGFLDSKRARNLSREGIRKHTIIIILDTDELLENHQQKLSKIFDPKVKAFYFKDFIIKDIILGPID